MVLKNYFTSIPYQPLLRPDRDLPIVDPKYVLKMPTVFKIEKSKKIFVENDITVKGVDDELLYQSSSVNNNLINSQNEVIISWDVSRKNMVRRFFLGKKRDKSVGVITEHCNNDILHRYSLEFVNNKTNTMERFYMNCDPDWYLGTILYGNLDQLKLVGRITKDQYEKRLFQMEMVAGVDSVYLLAVGLFFLNSSVEKNYGPKTSNNQKR